MKTQIEKSINPTANICINKSRVKIYDNEIDPKVYLSKQTEFQIELFNPTSDVVLAKITLNNKAISQGGLVLNPGQRVFLDRYLEVAKKFLFDTYEVSNTSEVKKAIENNGDIKVEFYKERQVYNGYLTFGSSNYTQNLGNYNSGTPYHNLRCGSSEVAKGMGFTSTSTNAVGQSSAFFNSTSLNTSVSLDMLKLSDEDESDEVDLISEAAPVKKLRTKSIETGRVEMGSDSDQEFKYVNKSFEYYPFHTVEYKMLPVSQKINTVADIQVKVYCTNCGSKLKKEYKFCPVCATRV